MKQQQKSSSQKTASAGEKIRKIADQLKQESNLQIKVTSQILGAAAQISANHDRLIDEVVDMVEEDLDNQVFSYQITKITVENLKQQFKTFGEAKAHFGLKASSWASLTYKLNNLFFQIPMSVDHFQISVPKRLDEIEGEIRIMHTKIDQILLLLSSCDRDFDR